MAQKFYNWSAKLDKWTKEIYALQLSLDMMVNEWTIKIAMRISDLEALQSVESEIGGTIAQLNTDIAEIASAQQTLTAQISEAQETVTTQDREFQTQVNTLELQLSAFAEVVTQSCSETGELGSLFVEKISALQTQIELISESVSIEFNVLVEMQNFVTSQEVAEWRADITTFTTLWENFFNTLNQFHTRAR